jgi:ferredoxin
MVSYTAKVDRELCVSAGACVETAPKAFGFDDEHIATVLPGAEQESNDKLLEVAKACPATAIMLYDEDGQEVDLFS